MPKLPMIFALGTSMLLGCGSTDPPSEPSGAPTIELAVMSFNIEYGGDRVDFGRVAAAIRAAGADLVGIQEAWGRLPLLARELGWADWDARLQVVSRFPLLDPPGGDGDYLLVEVRPGRVVAIGNLHLASEPYGPAAARDGAGPREVLRLEREVRLPQIAPVAEKLARLAAAGIPAFLTGDLNSPSWRDWTPATVGSRPQVRFPLDWPVSRALEAAGLRDSFRELHPDPLRRPGLTWPAARRRVEGWNPAPDEPRDRIDYVFAAGDATTRTSRLVGEPGGEGVEVSVAPWPSDHRGVVSSFEVRPAQMPLLVAVEHRRVERGERLGVRFRGRGETGELVVVRPEAEAGGAALEASTGSASQGRLELPTGALAAGGWAVALLAADGRELARTRFWLVEPGARPSLLAAASEVASGEPIPVEWRDAPGNRWDWVGVYPAGVDPPEAAPLLWKYTGATIAGATRLDRQAEGEGWPLPPGDYRLVLCLDDGYETAASAELRVLP